LPGDDGKPKTARLRQQMKIWLRPRCSAPEGFSFAGLSTAKENTNVFLCGLRVSSEAGGE
jgi:hypothetical protein